MVSNDFTYLLIKVLHRPYKRQKKRIIKRIFINIFKQLVFLPSYIKFENNAVKKKYPLFRQKRAFVPVCRMPSIKSDILRGQTRANLNTLHHTCVRLSVYIRQKEALIFPVFPAKTSERARLRAPNPEGSKKNREANATSDRVRPRNVYIPACATLDPSRWSVSGTRMRPRPIDTATGRVELPLVRAEPQHPGNYPGPRPTHPPTYLTHPSGTLTPTLLYYTTASTGTREIPPLPYILPLPLYSHIRVQGALSLARAHTHTHTHSSTRATLNNTPCQPDDK